MLRLLRAPRALLQRSHSRLSTSPAASSFDGLLSAFWAERLRSRGFVAPTEIQALALPSLMPVVQADGEAVPGRSAVLQAETGTGKTITYLLPMLEHLRLQLAAGAGGGGESERVTLAGLVVVPTRELAAQVLATATSLLPEGARFMRIISGGTAVGSNQEVGVLVATPVMLEANVAYRHLLWVRSVVLDEADMLLSGAFQPAVQGYLLARFKQRLPEDRPQHIFCGATVPCSGTKSVAAFLDRYYPPPAVLRIATPGCHRALPRVEHSFVQIDAALPLTRLEVSSQKLIRSRAIDELAAQGTAVSVPGTSREEQEAAGGAEIEAAATETDSVGGDEALDAGVPSAAAAVARHDAVADEMRRRALEDEAAELRADHEDYVSRVAGLRLHVLLEALLLPGRAAAAAAAAAASDRPAAASAVAARESAAAPAQAAEPAQPLASLGVPEIPSAVADGALPLPLRGSRASRRHSRIDVLGLSNGMPVARGRAAEAPAAAATAKSGGAVQTPPPPVARVTAATPVPFASASAMGGPAIVRLASPPALRTGLTPEECVTVPATLVFANSSAAAAALRKALKAAVPELAVEAVHARVDDDERARLLQRFADGRVRVLVCTDVLARGIDTLDAAHVIQAEFATDAVSHLHRVGRTGRAGRSGRVTSLVTRASLGLAERLAAAAAASAPVDGAFSRNRSLRRAAKKAALLDAMRVAAAGGAG